MRCILLMIKPNVGGEARGGQGTPAVNGLCLNEVSNHTFFLNEISIQVFPGRARMNQALNYLQNVDGQCVDGRSPVQRKEGQF